MGQFAPQLRALLSKNWILWRRNWVGSFLEIIIPVAFALIVYAFRELIPKEDVAEESFLNSAYNFYPSNASIPLPSSLVGGVKVTSTYQSNLPFYLRPCFAQNFSVAFSPQNTFTETLAGYLTPWGYTIKYFDSQSAINDYVTDSNYGKNGARLCFGVSFLQATTGNYQYALTFNTSNGNWGPDIPKTSAKRITDLLFQDQDNLMNYSKSGFLQVQSWIDNMILQQETGSSSASINASFASVHLPPTVQDDLPSTLSQFIPFYVCMPMIIPFLRLLHMLLSEKENRMKETMKMMGMLNTSFYLSWVIYGAIVYLVLALIWAGAIKATFALSNYGLLFIWIYLYLLTLIPLALLVNVFFDRAKMGVIGGLIAYFVLYFLSSQVSDTSSSGTLVVASLAPQIGVSLSATQILVFEGFGYGLTSESMQFEYQNYKIATAFGMFIFDFVIYFLLAIYLDQVVPTEYGVNKPICFCFCGRRRSRSIQDSQEDIENPNSSYDKNPDVEEVDPNLKAQEKTGDYIFINHLVKKYDSGKLAVNDLSMKMYKGQIFALLGHNGAGKTTTISILSGLYQATSGSIEILGKDVEGDMEEIHQFMGVCPQHNVLYEQLTIKEHLELFGTFKGVPRDQLDEEVNKMIVDTDLVEKKDYPAGGVSGGQKRKLSVGMAFIGGSKFIILDEPSSGMDTAARRKMWEMLKNYKQGRVVIITTHFMDEADYLGDRIAIMADGKLKCCGRSLFLKSKYGVGYNLTIVKKTADESKGIEEFIKNVIPSAKVVSDVSVEVSIQLPMETSNQFKDLFEDLDRNKDKLNIDSYGIAVTTLEEVFLKVAADKAHEEEIAKAKEEKDQPSPILENVKLDDIPRIQSDTQLFFTHLWMMILKRVWYLKRDVKGLLCEIFIPILFAIIGLLLMGISFGNNQPSLTLAPSMYPTPILSYYGASSTTNSIPNTFITNGFNNVSDYNLVGLSSTTLTDFDQQVYTRREVTPYRLGAFYFTTYDPSSYTYNYFTEVNTTAQESSTFFMNQVNQAILRDATSNPSATIKLVNSPFPMTQEMKSLFNSATGIVGVFVFGIAMAPIPASIISYIVREREQNIKHQQIVSGVSLLAYWLGNFIVDFVKHLIPAIVIALLAKAFSITTLTVDDCYGMTWLLFIFYGTAVISYSYLASFIFKDYGAAQTAVFLIGFLVGFLGTLIITILRIIPSTINVGKGLGFLLRLLPNFSFCYGLMNMANRSLYQYYDKLDSLPAAFSWEVSNWDLLYLGLETVVYMIFVMIIEVWRVNPACFSWFTREQSIPYKDIKYDDDVKREEERLMHADPTSMSVCVQKLRQVYNLGVGKHKVAVENVSFGLQKGECFALLGVNGAGKTSTFRILSGEYTQTEGHAYINGYDTLTDMRQIRPYIGYCPQFDALLDNLTSKEHLLIYAAIKGIPAEYREALVEKKLQEMDLKKFENVPAGTYSGGNKRKLSVAMALIGNPAIVLLDEPSSGMDPGARRFMWDVISSITTVTKDASIILTTHAMDEAEALSTKLAIMVDGTFKCMGSTQHIKNKFGKGYELEIKIKSPEESELNDFLKQVGVQPKTKISMDAVKSMFQKANNQVLIQTLSPEGAGSAIYHEIEQYGSVAAETPAAYLLIDHKSKKIFDFLQRNFGKYVLIEHIDTFFKFKIDIPQGLGKTFGLIEENKVALEISQYSLKQTSIEQIFNMFAMHKEEAFLQDIGKNAADSPARSSPEKEKTKKKPSSGPRHDE